VSKSDTASLGVCRMWGSRRETVSFTPCDKRVQLESYVFLCCASVKCLLTAAVKSWRLRARWQQNMMKRLTDYEYCWKAH